jgi:hypothetical protein
LTGGDQGSLFENCAHRYKDELGADVIIQSHVTDMNDTMLQNNLCRIVEPWVTSSVLRSNNAHFFWVYLDLSMLGLVSVWSRGFVTWPHGCHTLVLAIAV